MKHFVLGICIALCFLSVACGKHASDNQRLLELEREILLSSRTKSDSLLKEARKLCDDSLSRSLDEALKARDYGAAGQFDASYRTLLDVVTFCKRQQPGDRVYNILSYVENTFATNILYGSSSAEEATPSALQIRVSRELNGSAPDNTSDMAAAAYLKAIDYARKSGAGSRIPLAYYNLSMVYSGKSSPSTALYYCRKALLAADSIGWSREQSSFIYLALAEGYVDIRDTEHALRALKRGETVYAALPPEDRSLLYKTYAKVYHLEGKDDRALSYTQKALDEIRKGDVGKDYSYYAILMQYVDYAIGLRKDMDRLSGYVDKCRTFFARLGDKDNELYAGVLSLRLALARRQMDSARGLVRELKAKGVETGLVTSATRLAWYQTLDTYYRAAGELDMAYPCYRKAMNLNDSICGFAQRQYVANMGMEYRMDTLKLKHELTEQKQQGEIRTLNWKYLTATMAGVIIALCFIGYFVYNRRRRMLQHEKYMASMNRLKMQNIRNCISPHFTFNMLNREILLSPENGEVYNRLMNLAHLLRRSLDATSQVAISLADELDFTQTYIRMLQECGKRFAFHLHVDTSVNEHKTMIPSMLIQIPVENAVKHGFAGDDGEKDREIEITVFDRHTGIGVEIVNNGETYSPFNAADTKGGKGIGMQVIYQSLLLMNQKNKEKITFNISDRQREKKEGTRVSMYVPYNFDYSM